MSDTKALTSLLLEKVEQQIELAIGLLALVPYGMRRLRSKA